MNDAGRPSDGMRGMRSVSSTVTSAGGSVGAAVGSASRAAVNTAVVTPITGVVDYGKEILRRIKIHNVMVNAAGIAFYGLLALVPTLIALVSIYALVADPAEIETQVADVAGSLDDTTRDFLTDQLKSIVGDVEDSTAAAESADDDGIAGTVGRIGGLAIGILLALFSASSAVQKLMGTINQAYEVEDQRPGWKVRALAYLFTAAAIVGLALMALSITIIPTVLDRVDLGSAAETAITVLRLPVMGLLFGGALTVLYRYGPDRSPRTPWRNLGAVVATGLFVLFAIAFSVYSSNVGLMPASYGLLGSIAALMIFLQLTALAVIVGAEVNGAIEVGRVLTTAALSTDGTTAAGAAASFAPAGRSSGRTRAGNGNSNGHGNGNDEPTIGFGKALAGLLALFALGRGVRRD